VPLIGTGDPAGAVFRARGRPAGRGRLPVWAWGLGQSEIAGISANIFTRRTMRRAAQTRSDVTHVGRPTRVRVRVVDPETGRKQPRGKPGLLMVNTRTRSHTQPVSRRDRSGAKPARGRSLPACGKSVTER
jgi:hypothetical protein